MIKVFRGRNGYAVARYPTDTSRSFTLYLLHNCELHGKAECPDKIEETIESLIRDMTPRLCFTDHNLAIALAVAKSLELSEECADAEKILNRDYRK